MACNIVLENAHFTLTLGEDAVVTGLFCKDTGEECICSGQEMALFSVTQERPFNNEIKLAHPNKRTVFQANRVRREEDRLVVGFEIIPYEAVIRVDIAPDYIGFRLEKFIVLPDHYNYLVMDTPAAVEFRLLQLAVKNRERFGEWLNVSFDEKTAVNVLGGSPYTKIEAERRPGCRVMTADAVEHIGMQRSIAVLIACATDSLMDCIGAMENAYGLPHGAESRHSEWIDRSYFWVHDINPTNVDEYIRYAKQAGMRMMLIYEPSIFRRYKETDTQEERMASGYSLLGDYDYRPEYPNGREDLVNMLKKITDAGILPGIHFLQTFIGVRSRYVTPVADPRLNKKRLFMLAKPLGKEDTEIYVEQDPTGAPMHDRCRVLQFGGEMISYKGYTTERPYRFTGCTRGWFKTNAAEHPFGEIGGVSDICEFGATSIYMDQNTSLPEEIADKLADIYDAGFRFVYFDGSEGTNTPHAFHVPYAQYRVYSRLKNVPLFTEGAAKAHFSWHHLSGGNAFDTFEPEVFKQNLARFPAEEAPRMRNDFTRLNFGWWIYRVPAAIGTQGTSSPLGTQPDIYEYGTSIAAAWDCPTGIYSELEAFRAHPRTADNLEVLRRWENVRASGWLTEERKQILRDTSKEHILLIDENGGFELQEYRQIPDAANGDRTLRAFVMERKGAHYVVFWHTEGEGMLKLPVKAADVTVTDELGSAPYVLKEADGCAVLPVSSRRYLRTELADGEITEAFRKAEWM